MLKKIISFYDRRENYIETSKITQIIFELKEETISHYSQDQWGHGYTYKSHIEATIYLQDAQPIKFDLYPDPDNKDKLIDLINNQSSDISKEISAMIGEKEEYHE